MYLRTKTDVRIHRDDLKIYINSFVDCPFLDSIQLHPYQASDGEEIELTFHCAEHLAKDFMTAEGIDILAIRQRMTSERY